MHPHFLLTTLFLLLLATTHTSATTHSIWVREFGSTDYDSVGDIAFDSNENTIYVCGAVQAAVPDAGTFHGNKDMIVAKYDIFGQRLWIRDFGTDSVDELRGVAVGIGESIGDGHLFAVGSSEGSFHGLQNLGSKDFVVLHLNKSTGDILRAQQVGTSESDIGNAIELDTKGDIFIGGSVSAALPGQQHHGMGDAAVFKLTSNLTQVWGVQTGTGGSDTVNSMTIGPMGDVYATGGSSLQAALWKLNNTSGNWTWSTILPTSEVGNFISVAVDTGDCVYAVGYTNGAVSGFVNAGSNDMMVSKWHGDNGSLVWANQMGSDQSDGIGGVAISPDQHHLYVSGYASGVLNGVSNVGLNDVALLKLLAGNGSALWTEMFGSTAVDMGSGLVFSNNDIYVAGTSRGNMGDQTNPQPGNDAIVLIKFYDAEPSPTPSPGPRASLAAIEWRWLTGSSSGSHSSVATVKGVFSSTFTPGGRVSASMVGTEEEMYLFGGLGYTTATPGDPGALGDLWVFRNHEWAWLGGMISTTRYPGVYNGTADRYPGGRWGSCVWFHAPDLVMVFGGKGYDIATDGTTGLLSDTWMFNRTSLEWRHRHGPALKNTAATYGTLNTPGTPGARVAGAVLTNWTSTTAQIFGGRGIGLSTSTCDVWEWDPGANTFSWVNGPSVFNEPSFISARGQFHTENHPGGRNSVYAIPPASKGWAYIFGGSGYTHESAGTALADLWAWDPQDKQWAWVSGQSNLVDDSAPAVFGLKRAFFWNYAPGARRTGVGMSDPNSDLIHLGFGYYRHTAATSLGYMSDIWSYNATSSLWAWSGGGTLLNVASVVENDMWYDPDNAPGGRSAAVSATMGSEMFVFGGWDGSKRYNDLWSTFGPAITPDPSPTTSPTPSASPTASPTPSSSPTTSPTPSPSPSSSPSSTPTVTPVVTLGVMQWRWLSGSSVVNEDGVYGPIGVFGTSFTPGGRFGCAAVIAPSNIAYVVGGQATDFGSPGELDEVWAVRHDEAIGRASWAFLAGTSGTKGLVPQYTSPQSIGGRREPIAWFASPDQLLLFGGFKTSRRSDLWCLNTTSLSWTWINGPSDLDVVGTYVSPSIRPGARNGASVFTSDAEKGLAWVGYGYGVGHAATPSDFLADVFRYNASSNDWEWMAGSSVAATKTSHQTAIGVFSTLNYPGGRGYCAVVDSYSKDGRAYLMGGFGYAATTQGYLAQLWGYQIKTSEFALISGNSLTVDSQGTYSDRGAFFPTFKWGGTYGAVGFSDPNSDLYYFVGGFGRTTSNSMGYIEAVWAYNATLGEAAWVWGSSALNDEGAYASSVWYTTANVPAPRRSSIGELSGFTYLTLTGFVRDDLGLMYVFGGLAGADKRLSDLWVTTGPIKAIRPSPSPSPSASPSPSPPAALLSIYPPWGPTSGDTDLHITGDELHLIGSADVTVFFDADGESRSVVGHRTANNHEIKCRTPRFHDAAINVTVLVQAQYTNITCPQKFQYYSNFTLTKATPPLTYSSGGASIHLFGANIPHTSIDYFTVRLWDSDGNNVTTKVTSFFYTNSTLGVSFTAPSFEAYYNTSQSLTFVVTLDVAPNGQQYFPATLPFTYYAMPTLASVSPSQGQTRGGYNITATGAGFFDSGLIHCQFGAGVVGPGFYVSETTIFCLVPHVDDARIVSPFISMDGQSYFAGDNIKFMMVEFVSEYCRFKAELPTFRPDRVQLGLHYFENLALGAEVTTSPRRDDYDKHVGRVLSPTQIVDGDRCCEYTLQTDGYKCGVVFDTNSSAIDIAYALIDLGHEAYVNEILTSWFRPCKNLPDPGYTVEVRPNDTASWSLLLERSAWSENPCTTVSGDKGPTAFCADFFAPVVGRQFRLTFNNTPDHFLVGETTDGGWLLEYEVHGIYLKTPYQLQCGAAPVFVRSGLTVPVPPIVVETLSILGENLNSSTADSSRSVTVTAKYLAPVPVTAVQGSHNFSSLYLVRPPVGVYTIYFKSSGVKPCNTTITVSQGVATSLKARVAIDKTYPSASVVSLDEIFVEAFDDGSNLCSRDTLSRNVTVTGTVLSGTLWANMTVGYTSFPAIKLINPPTGIHTLVFSTPGLASAALNISVRVGTPKKMSLDPYDLTPRASAPRVDAPPVHVRILDAGGTFASSATTVVNVQLISGPSQLNGNVTVSAVAGVAVFSGLTLSSPHAWQYILQFTSADLPDAPPLNATVTVVPGPPTTLFIVNTTAIHGSYGSDVFTRIDPIALGCLDAGGNRVPATGNVFVHGSPLLSGDTVVDMENGTAVASNLTLLSPPSGTYRLNFTMLGVVHTSMLIDVVPGTAVSLKLVRGQTQSRGSAAQVLLDRFDIVAIDAGGDVAPSGIKAGGHGDPNVTVSTTTTLTGTLTVPMRANGSVELGDVTMLAPKAGTYSLLFQSSNGLKSVTATIAIAIGPPHRLVVQQPDSSKCEPACAGATASTTPLCCRTHLSTRLPTITVRAVDAGGDFVGSLHPSVSLTIHAAFTSNSSAAWKGNTSQPLVNGEAHFSGFVLESPSTGRYLIDFSSPTLVGTQLSLDVAIGDPTGMLILSGQTDTPYPCVAQTQLSDVSVQLLDAGGTRITQISSATITLLLKVVRVDDRTVVVIGTKDVDVSAATGVAQWTGLEAGAPTIGVLEVQITGPASLERRYAAFNATIANGPTTAFDVVLSSTAALRGAAMVPLPTITVRELDAGGNRAANSTTQRTATLTLPKQRTELVMRHGECTFIDVFMTKPLAGNYQLHVNVTGLPTVTKPLEVVSGPAKTLKLNSVTPPQSDNTNDLTVNLEVLDGAGNRISETVEVEVELVVADNTTLQATLGGTPKLATDVAAAVTFTDLKLRGRRAVTYTLLFTVVGSRGINATAAVPIQSCTERTPGSIATPPDERDCVCPAGSAPTVGKCVLCGQGTFKAIDGPFDCAPCKLAHTTSAVGVTSEAYCKCKAGYYYNSVTAECTVCDTVMAECPGGDLGTIGNPKKPETIGPIFPKQGHWRAAASQPWDIISCPAQQVACVGGVNASACQQNYHGPLCSLCDAGFAPQGYVCYPCSDLAANIPILAGGVIVLFFLLRFYVRKQMLGGRSPEATVLKVIVNYVQVIAFVGAFRARWSNAMQSFYMYMGAAANVEVLSIQPIDCVLHPNYYGYFAFYVSLPIVSFVVPFALYHVAAGIRRLFGKRGKKRREEEEESTVTAPVVGGEEMSVMAVLFWPFTLFFLHTLPHIPKAIRNGLRGVKRWFGRRFESVWRRIAGDDLVLEEGEGDTGPVVGGGSIRGLNRTRSIVDSAVAHQTRETAKHQGGVLFEEDPMTGRNAMSVTKGAFWILFFLLLPTIIKNAMELFNCRSIGGVEYIDRDLGVKCNTDTHRLLMLLFWIAVVPFLSILILYVVFKNVILRKRRRLVQFLPLYNLCWTDAQGHLRLPPGTQESTGDVLRREQMSMRRLRKYLFLFSGYRTEGVLYMWDLVIMARKIAIAAILVFARHEVVLQIFFALLVFVAALILHLVFRPFDDDYAREKKMRVLPSTLEFVSIIATIFTLMAGLLFQQALLTDTASTVLDWLVLVTNLAVLFVFLWLLFDALRNKISRWTQRCSARKLRSPQSRHAAGWWKRHVGCCEWGVGVTMEEEGEGEEIELSDVTVPEGRSRRGAVV